MTRTLQSSRRGLLRVTAVAAALASACEDPATPPTTPPPSIQAATAVPPASNALSLEVWIASSATDSLRVMATAPDGLIHTTPFQPVAGDSSSVHVLGLRASTSYTLSVEALGPGGRALHEGGTATTGPLPSRLAELVIETSGQSSSEFTLVNAVTLGTPGVVYAFDSEGQIRWYREFPEYPAAPNPAKDTRRQPGGTYTTFIGESSGYEPVHGRYVEYDAAGAILREIVAADERFTDGHELYIHPETGERYLFGYYHETADLTEIGGLPDALLATHVIQRQAADGALLWEWDAGEYLSLDDWIEAPESLKQRAVTDFDHPNSLQVDATGNVLVSWRHLGEVSYIDGGTGELLWRLGGRNSDFVVINDPLGGFSGQHMARLVGPDRVLLFDNGLTHTPPESRAVEYQLDVDLGTAEMVWQYRHNPPIYSIFVSGAERLANGNTLIGFGVPGHIVEASPSGAAVWEARITWQGQPAIFYRAQPLEALY